jgi:hypothetical protein
MCHIFFQRAQFWSLSSFAHPAPLPSSTREAVRAWWPQRQPRRGFTRGTEAVLLTLTRGQFGSRMVCIECYLPFVAVFLHTLLSW